MMNTERRQRVMVSFKISDGEDCIIERMHAIKSNGEIYILDNSPFYAFDISFGDSFLTALEGEDLVFSKVMLRGGHSTYRVKLAAGRDHAFFLKNWTVLEDLGCTFEGSSANNSRLYSIDVPPETDVSEVYRILEEKEFEKIWVFEEAHYFDSEAKRGE